jgi:hypothetical protein
MSPKTKLKTFFKSGEGSESAVELLVNWILPFSRGMKKASVDDVIGAFFAVDDRLFAYVKAKRNFVLPGKYYVAGNRPVIGAGLAFRKITKGQVLLMAIDRVDGTARVEVGNPDEGRMFLLERFEVETIKDWLNVIE